MNVYFDDKRSTTPSTSRQFLLSTKREVYRRDTCRCDDLVPLFDSCYCVCFTGLVGSRLTDDWDDIIHAATGSNIYIITLAYLI